jgi:predicted MFS family arabinose efflux permease
VVQIAIALGASSGGLLIDHEGYRATFAFCALILVTGASGRVSLGKINR